MTKVHLTVIAKAPVAGLVKTRMVPPCTFEQAAEAAAAALADTLDAVEQVAQRAEASGFSIRRVLLLDGPPQPWMPQSFDVVRQRGDGLGERLHNGFADLGAGLIVGMECPHAVPGLAVGLTALQAGRDVLGLATDGGYWAIGLSGSPEGLFEGIPMSRSNTGMSQLRRLHQRGRSVALLAMARDLDDVDDLASAAQRGAGRLGAVAQRILAEV